MANDVEDAFTKGVAEGKRLYGIAEGEVDGWFAKNKYTVLILAGVAIAGLWLAVKLLSCIAS